MEYAADSNALIRIEHLLDVYFPGFPSEGWPTHPSNVFTFRRILLRRGAHIMGSFPLFCLCSSGAYRSWVSPGDMDIFLRPCNLSETCANLRLFEELFAACGYYPVLNPLMTPYLSLIPAMIVLTFVKAGINDLKIQIIFHPFIPSSQLWYVRFMGSFDLSCCCVAYDGERFWVTRDNQNPTSQPVKVRHWNHSTRERVVKYLRRGFSFV